MICFLLQERKKKILEQSNVLAKSVNGHTLSKEGLLDEVIDVFSFGEICSIGWYLNCAYFWEKKFLVYLFA